MPPHIQLEYFHGLSSLLSVKEQFKSTKIGVSIVRRQQRAWQNTWWRQLNFDSTAELTSSKEFILRKKCRRFVLTLRRDYCAETGNSLAKFRLAFSAIDSSSLHLKPIAISRLEARVCYNHSKPATALPADNILLRFVPLVSQHHPSLRISLLFDKISCQWA